MLPDEERMTEDSGPIHSTSQASVKIQTFRKRPFWSHWWHLVLRFLSCGFWYWDEPDIERWPRDIAEKEPLKQAGHYGGSQVWELNEQWKEKWDIVRPRIRSIIMQTPDGSNDTNPVVNIDAFMAGSNEWAAVPTVFITSSSKSYTARLEKSVKHSGVLDLGLGVMFQASTTNKGYLLIDMQTKIVGIRIGYGSIFFRSPGVSLSLTRGYPPEMESTPA